jgi:hypothetical protein
VLSVDIAVSSHVPLVRVHALVQGPVAFEATETFDGEGARGDYMGEYPGVVRPMVDWTTRFQPSRETSGISLSEAAAP